MKVPFSLFTVSLVCAVCISCENPADLTADAEVGPALEKAVDSGPDGAAKWAFMENSYIEFTGSKVNGGTQVGRFTNISGHFTIKDGEPVGNDHKVEIDMNSITTEKEKLTAHLKNDDFFDVPSHPISSYDVTSIKKTGEGQYDITGNLTMKGKTNSVTFSSTVVRSETTVAIRAKFDLKRYQWDINFKGAGENILNEEVILDFNLEAAPEGS
tara:strand:+ start:936 stop:1574 length:639 start_codon:yes stop_codon:yes gene_type:complete